MDKHQSRNLKISIVHINIEHPWPLQSVCNNKMNNNNNNFIIIIK